MQSALFLSLSVEGTFFCSDLSDIRDRVRRHGDVPCDRIAIEKSPRVPAHMPQSVRRPLSESRTRTARGRCRPGGCRRDRPCMRRRKRPTFFVADAARIAVKGRIERAADGAKPRVVTKGFFRLFAHVAVRLCRKDRIAQESSCLVKMPVPAPTSAKTLSAGIFSVSRKQTKRPSACCGRIFS